MTAPAAHPLTELEPTGWPDDAAADVLIGDWSLWQRRGGHRTSTDDLLTAWMGARAVGFSPVARYLDIGCGIGSVLLMTAHRVRPTEAVGVEAQAQSVMLAQRSIAELPGHPAIRAVHRDLRALTVGEFGRFDLITGSPPYLPVGTAVPSADAQRRACRLELRGGVEAYCEAASGLLAPGGRFSLVFQSVWTPRVYSAAAGAGLVLVDQVDVQMRDGDARPFLSVYTFAHSGAGAASRAALAVRSPDGMWTDAYCRLRAELGLSTEQRRR